MLAFPMVVVYGSGAFMSKYRKWFANVRFTKIKTYQRKKEFMSMEACPEVKLSNKKEVMSAWKLHLEKVRNQQENLSVELLWQVLCELEQDFFIR